MFISLPDLHIMIDHVRIVLKKILLVVINLFTIRFGFVLSIHREHHHSLGKGSDGHASNTRQDSAVSGGLV